MFDFIKIIFIKIIFTKWLMILYSNLNILKIKIKNHNFFVIDDPDYYNHSSSSNYSFPRHTSFSTHLVPVFTTLQIPNNPCMSDSPRTCNHISCYG